MGMLLPAVCPSRTADPLRFAATRQPAKVPASVQRVSLQSGLSSTTCLVSAPNEETVEVLGPRQETPERQKILPICLALSDQLAITGTLEDIEPRKPSDSTTTPYGLKHPEHLLEVGTVCRIERQRLRSQAVR